MVATVPDEHVEHVEHGNRAAFRVARRGHHELAARRDGAILAELGYGTAAISTLREKGRIG